MHAQLLSVSLAFCFALVAVAQKPAHRASRFGTLAAATTGQAPANFLPSVMYEAQKGPAAVATADFDSDGYADLAVANVASSSVSVYFGNGDGRLLPR
jgi:hypothetical protein